MEIKKEIVEKEFNYIKTFLNANKSLKGNSIFVAMLFTLISSSSAYATSIDWTGPDIVGGLEVPNEFIYSNGFAIFKLSLIVVSAISLITTIIFSVKMHKQKKIEKSEENNENEESSEEKNEENLLKKMKRRLIISSSIFVISTILVAVSIILYITL